ncbi:HB1/Asxl, restriction endonuclease HTH domain-containing protein [Artemisia annua]|uniref:HB1/Asxl, restriction endonuclease HTH domain-containing protein n=1 Tax=Artemisia annua TaxID=35608 RepID=A0A2U1MIH2_ARTAN|nr:HB1/Asxl, restriction endonuclease HTH domain-containing protein [Artemisia annua]
MPTTEGSQSPLIPVTEGQDGYIAGQTVGQINNNGYNTAERSRLQLKAYIGHKAEEMIFVELQSGGWRLIDSEEVFDALLLLLDTRGPRISFARDAAKN